MIRNGTAATRICFKRRVGTSESGRDVWNSVITSKIRHPTEPNSTKQLDGTSFFAKDNFTSADDLTTCASKVLSNHKSLFDATAVKLLKNAGLELVGKTNLDEFGMGASNTNSYFGDVINPFYENELRIVGGSSGGSAAVVSGNLADFALGTDTGGSVRLPASYCGIIGLKPTYGRISRWGVVPYAQTLDTVGILAKDIDIVEKVYNVLNVHDEKDPTCLPQDVRDCLKTVKKDKLRIGIPKEFVLEGLSPETSDMWIQVMNELQEMGHTIVSVSIPTMKKALLAYYTLISAEVASNLARYDGVRYGLDNSKASTFIDQIADNRSDGFGLEAKRRIILGNYTLSSSSGNHYLTATELRKQIVEEFNEIFNVPHLLLNSKGEVRQDACDVLVVPTAMGPAPTIKEYKLKTEENFLNGYINDILTIAASLTGTPAISIPRGGLGIQIIGQYADDQKVLDLAKTLI